jgi:hypothetical protein
MDIYTQSICVEVFFCSLCERSEKWLESRVPRCSGTPEKPHGTTRAKRAARTERAPFAFDDRRLFR